jgi:hypothetical protein
MSASIHSRYIKNRNLAFWTGHRKRIVDAIGPDVVKVIKDFTDGPGIDTAFDNEWTVTRVEAGAGESTVTRTDAVGGALLITTDAAENDGVNMQLIGESFELTSDQELYFGLLGLKISDATQSDFFAGLAITDTDILGGVTDRIGFEKLDGATAIKAMLEKDSTETLTASLHTAVADTAVDLEWYWDGTGVEFFVDGASAATPAVTNLPNDEFLRPSIHFLAGEAVAKTFTLDKLVIIQFGR